MLLTFKIDIVSQHLYAEFAGKFLGQDETMKPFEKQNFFQNFMPFRILSLVFSSSFFSITNSI